MTSMTEGLTITFVLREHKNHLKVSETLFNSLFRQTMQKLGNKTYCQTLNISRTLVGNKIVDHLIVVGAWPVGAAPTTSSFST